MIPQLFNAQLAQYTTPTTISESSVTIEDGIKCYLPELKISGQTIQRQCGINMMDISKINTSDPSYNSSVLITSVDSSVGKIVLKTAEQISGTFSGYKDTGVQFKDIFPNMEIGKTYYLYGSISVENGGDSPRQYIYINVLDKYWNYGASLTVDESIYNTTGNLVFYASTTPGATTTISNLMIVESDIVEQVGELKYEPYQPLSPEYPQDIKNAGDSGIEVIVKGRNLFDVKNSGGFKDDWGTISSVIEGNTIITTSTHTANRGSTLKLGTFPVGDYCISYEQWGYPDDASIGTWVNGKSINKPLTKDTKYQQLTLTEESLISLYYTVPAEKTVFISGLQIIEGNYNEKPEYVPYIEPQIISIPSSVEIDGKDVNLRFAKYDDNNYDSLEIDGVNKKVIYKQRLDELIIPAEEFTQSLYYTHSNSMCILAPNVLRYRCDRSKGYCSHAGKEYVNGAYIYTTGAVWFGVDNWYVYWIGIISILGYDADWEDKTKPTDEEWGIALAKFQAWLKEHEGNGDPFKCIYVIPETYRKDYDITNIALGKRLLGLIQNNGTTIIEISNANNLSQTLSAKYLTHS